MSAIRVSYDLKSKEGRQSVKKDLIVVFRSVKHVVVHTLPWLISDTFWPGRTYRVFTEIGKVSKDGSIISSEAVSRLNSTEQALTLSRGQSAELDRMMAKGKVGISMGYKVSPNGQPIPTHVSLDPVPNVYKQITIKSGRGTRSVSVNADRIVSYICSIAASHFGYKPGGTFDLVREADKKVLDQDLPLIDQWDDDKTVFWLAEIGSAV